MQLFVHRFWNRVAGLLSRAAIAWVIVAGSWPLLGAAANTPGGAVFPPPLDAYGDSSLTSVRDILLHRAQQEPLNVFATLLFLCAIVHTFMTHRFRHWAHVLEHSPTPSDSAHAVTKAPHRGMLARALHFLGEIEAVFALWVLPLFWVLVTRVGVGPTLNYIDHRVSFAEPVFVVVIMTIAATRPVLELAERLLGIVAGWGGGRPIAWWLSILTLGPLLGSLMTEPAAMTISALLLARQFYIYRPPAGLAYATLGLLFVNISVGGTLTHFAAPPVLMVAQPWQWTSLYMLQHFGWIAAVGILIANAAYTAYYWRDLTGMRDQGPKEGESAEVRHPVPFWITAIHLVFMAFAVVFAHHPPLLFFTLFFFVAFYEVTEDYQSPLALRPAILVGLFLAGLVIHGGLQQWWIEPVLGHLGELPLFFGAMTLTAFNDNAAITYLATLVPNLSEALKQAVVAGAVAGGGLTVIANAPNPAGQAILNRFFENGISPVRLLLGALPPTAIVALCFVLLQ